jgi:hypothetical protein
MSQSSGLLNRAPHTAAELARKYTDECLSKTGLPNGQLEKMTTP